MGFPGQIEYGVITVFDVTSPSLSAAARLVRDTLVAYEDLVGKQDEESTIESWWFPEQEVKHIDNNDNADMTLVRRDFLRAIIEAYDGGDAEGLESLMERVRGQANNPAL